MEEKKMDDNYTVASTTGSDNDSNFDESEEAIAKRLREKIRSQAEDLLNRVDSIRDQRRRQPATVERQLPGASMKWTQRRRRILHSCRGPFRKHLC
jgi:hypothetical protein